MTIYKSKTEQIKDHVLQYNRAILKEYIMGTVTVFSILEYRSQSE